MLGNILDSVDTAPLIQIFNIKTKKELEQYCKSITINNSDFTALILAAQAGVLYPYKYASSFQDKIPVHLKPKQEEMRALGQAKKGPLEGDARKCVRRVFQLFIERRCLAAHLFYTSNWKYWHLFYFDQRDQLAEKNHWRLGPHIHLVNDLWSNLSLEDVWNKIKGGERSFPSIHIRFLEASAKDACKEKYPAAYNISKI
ncbi:MAG: hypothetical protein M0Z48_10860 [Nitrospiraceae bacterium]|nr:hypothetical protein [Nitrospiraceae bacterium]